MCRLLSGLSPDDDDNDGDGDGDDGLDCPRVRRSMTPELEEALYEYARRNLLWLNVYVKVSQATGTATKAAATAATTTVSRQHQ